VVANTIKKLFSGMAVKRKGESDKLGHTIMPEITKGK